MLWIASVTTNYNMKKNADQMKYFRFNKIVMMMMRGINIDDWVFACMQIPKYIKLKCH